MSTSKTPPLQPASSQKKKRKYSNWDTHITGGLSSRQASYRASMLAKRNGAVSSNATLHVPSPACTSNQQSHVPSPACASNQQSHVPSPACGSSQKPHVPSCACMSSQQSHVTSQQSHVALPSCASSQQSPIPLPTCASSQQSHVPSLACASSQQSPVPFPACASSRQSHVPLPACASSQQSQTPIKSPSYIHSRDCNLVCQYCGSYFWHGERMTSFSAKRPLKFIRCCKGAISDTVAEESCSSSTLTKQRLSSEHGSGESVQQSGTKDKIESGRSELADIQFEVSTEIQNNILPYVNKLRDHRNRAQNVVLFDGQDRLVKVVSFVSSLLDKMKKPILIIASSSARLLWEMEFLKWSKLINVVTYKGTKDIRAAIRGSKFQVLLSSPDAIVEDIETLEHIKWELLVIDECQCPAISMHLKKFQMLMADMKLLTVSSEPVDMLQNYRNILSLVDCKNEKIQNDADMEMKDDISILKERLLPFIAFECNLKRTQKETSAIKVLQIPASALVQPNSLGGSGLRFPAPHLWSSPSMFASFCNRPTTGEPSPEPLPSVNSQTADKHCPV